MTPDHTSETWRNPCEGGHLKTMINGLEQNSISTHETPTRQELQRRIAIENRVGLGWLRFTCSVSYLHYWLKRVKSYFRTTAKSRGKGWNGYLESYGAGMGIMLSFTPNLTQQQRDELGVKRSPNEGYLTVDIPQTALDSLSGLNLYKFLIDVCGCDGLKVTRADIYYDDFTKVISPESLHHQCKQGGVGVPRFENMRGWDEYHLQNGASQGYTLYFGSNRSEKQIRFYDKFHESGGRINCYRWELELKGQYAEKFGEHLMQCIIDSLDCGTLNQSLEFISNCYKELLKGSIAFYDVPPGVRPRDLPRNWAARSRLCWWWAELLAGLEPAKLTLDRVKPSLQRSVEWIVNQVSPSLALIRMMYQHWGIPFHHWLVQQLEKGEERFSDRHFQMIEDAMIVSPAT